MSILFWVEQRRDGDSRRLIMMVMMLVMLRAFSLLLLASLQRALLAVRQPADGAGAARGAEAAGAEGAVVLLLAGFALATHDGAVRECWRGRRKWLWGVRGMGWWHIIHISVARRKTIHSTLSRNEHISHITRRHIYIYIAMLRSSLLACMRTILITNFQAEHSYTRRFFERQVRNKYQ